MNRENVKAMSSKLRKHRAVSRDEDDDGGEMEDDDGDFADEEEITENIDPRWKVERIKPGMIFKYKR